MRREIGPWRLFTARHVHALAARNLSYKPIFNTKLLLSVVFGVVFAVSGVVCQSSQSTLQQKPAERPFNMLVLGDSVLWSEGLKAEHKSWYQVKIWIEKT